jgi:hypothetical protein
MPLPDKPQFRFLTRFSGLFVAALALWWLVLVGPLREWVRLSTAVLLDAAGAFQSETSVAIQPDGTWMIQAPVPGTSAAMRDLGARVRYRSIRLQVAQWIPTLQTVSLPLYWALLLAAGRTRGWWRALAGGTAVLLAIPPVSLLVYAAHVIQRNLYPHSAPKYAALLDFADYVCGTALPYITPVLLALAMHRNLRATILGTAESVIAGDHPLGK